MAVYAIGDLQGCLEPLQRLLDELRFDPATDRLWFAGDLVNRGPQSLETLRFVHALGETAHCVLGNHDLHLIAVAYGLTRYHKPGDTLIPVLEAPDRDALLDWLRHRPLMHVDPTLGYAMVHAGLPPQWDIPQAQAMAGEVEAVLRGDGVREFLAHMYGNEPHRWRDDLQGMARLRFAVNCFTRMRYCDADGRLDFQHKGAPGTQPAPLLPWFEAPARAWAGTPVVCGHWSTLGLRLAGDVRALDTGCLWGGRLTALRLDDEEQMYAVPCPSQRKPG
ncbi:symmetrical bis(5'-nucleosyl)-tetraphosphatase [Ectothiorhodospiraceae bacterium 2226]|nr:symmetrical bis(5'-nucleosyl)-tetraphosphatase [Ectothiorhodospiraceae bacterium 2226]